MGMLDDAIREHLELKRRHGADSDEVARQEAEALGPARREPPAPAGFEDAEEPRGTEAEEPQQAPYAEAGQAEPAVYAETAYDDDVEEDYDAHGGYEEELHRPPVGEEPEDAPAVFSDAPRPVPVPEPEPDPLAGDPDAGATREWDVEAELRRDEEPVAEEAAWLEDEDAEPGEEDEEEDEASEDVLEETPEFLQETPEHDRLWFEQRPPRDFDFDG
jgi:hypothetical protein